MTLIIPYDESAEEPIKFRVVDKTKGLDFMVPVSTGTAMNIAEDLLRSVRRRMPNEEKTQTAKVRVRRGRSRPVVRRVRKKK